VKGRLVVKTDGDEGACRNFFHRRSGGEGNEWLHFADQFHDPLNGGQFRDFTGKDGLKGDKDRDFHKALLSALKQMRPHPNFCPAIDGDDDG
jgi:hypothetical protein